MGIPKSTGCSFLSVPSLFCLAIFVVSVLSTCVTAYEMRAMQGTFDSVNFKRMEDSGEIHIDRRAPPVLSDKRLAARDVSTTGSSTSSVSISISSATTAVSSKPTQQSPSTHASTGTASAQIITTSGLSNGTATATSTSSTSTFSTPSSFPTPFDTSLGNNFTGPSCPAFFNNFISNATFDDCAPASLLLQNSMAFFRAARSASYLNKVLDNSCSASLAICTPLMASLAGQLLLDSNCGADYRRQNPIVMQAYVGLVAYEPLYNATCLQNQHTSNYCFTDAITNSSSPSDLYPYYTALGLNLPSTATPSCNTCLQQTMNIFAGYAQQKEQPLAKTYVSCAQQVDSVCGASFAQTDVKVATISGKNAGTRSTISMSALSLGALTFIWMTIM